MSLHGILITYQRPVDLERCLGVLAAQTRRLDSLLVIDNGSAEERSLEGEAARSVEHIPTGSNLGPAGGLSIGVSQLLSRGELTDDDWVVFLDDDDPPTHEKALELMLGFAERSVASDRSIAGVGLTGARLNRSTGVLERLPDSDLDGMVDVDYVGGGQLPFYRAGTLREVGMPCGDLFFGFDDLDLGLRLREAGYRLVCDGSALRASRAAAGRLGLGTRLASPTRDRAPHWRDFYSARNAVYIFRTHRLWRSAIVRSVVLLGKPTVNIARRRPHASAHLRQALHAVADGWIGRLGRTVEPSPSSC